MKYSENIKSELGIVIGTVSGKIRTNGIKKLMGSLSTEYIMKSVTSKGKQSNPTVSDQLIDLLLEYISVIINLKGIKARKIVLTGYLENPK